MSLETTSITFELAFLSGFVRGIYSMLSHRLNRDELPPGQSRCLRSPVMPWFPWWWYVKLGSWRKLWSFFFVFFFGNKKNLWKKHGDLVVSLGKMLGFYGTVVFFLWFWTFATKNCHESWANLGSRTSFVVLVCHAVSQKTSSNFHDFHSLHPATKNAAAERFVQIVLCPTVLDLQFFSCVALMNCYLCDLPFRNGTPGPGFPFLIQWCLEVCISAE